MKLYFYKLIFFLLLINFSAKAQIDKEFWFVAPEVSSSHEDKPIILRLTTLENSAVVTVSQPANPSFSPITLNIPANTADSINLTAYIASIENRPANTILDKGIYIQSTSLINAFYEVAAPNNSEIFVLKGENALGLKFYTPFQTDYENGYGPWYGSTTFSTIDIVATENNTTVSITPTKDAVDHPAGVPFTIILNKGQTYSVQASGLTGPDHLTGTLIISDKPIAVTLKDDTIKNTLCIAQGNFDLVGEQIIPVSKLEDEYIILKGKLQGDEKVYIVAVEDKTSIFVNGALTPIATINAGVAFTLSISEPCVRITTSGDGGSYAPAYLLQLSGFDCELTTSMTPPVICTGSKKVGLLRTTQENFFLKLSVIAGNESFFTLNNQKGIINASDFSEVPGTKGEWKWAFIDLTSLMVPGKAYILNNDSIEFQAGVLMGDKNKGARSGYFTSFSDNSIDLGGPYEVCPGTSKVIDAGAGFAVYGWSTGESTRSIIVNGPGRYAVSVINKASCILEDSVNVLCSITEVNELIVKNLQAAIAPNPVEKGTDLLLSINNVAQKNKILITLYNLKGIGIYQKLIENETGDVEIEIPIAAEIGEGLYLLKVQSGEYNYIKKIDIK